MQPSREFEPAPYTPHFIGALEYLASGPLLGVFTASTRAVPPIMATARCLWVSDIACNPFSLPCRCVILMYHNAWLVRGGLTTTLQPWQQCCGRIHNHGGIVSSRQKAITHCQLGIATDPMWRRVCAIHVHAEYFSSGEVPWRRRRQRVVRRSRGGQKWHAR